MPKSTVVQIDVRNLTRMAMFINAVEEIAGTTSDPNTATNLRAALNKLYGRTEDGRV
jgi:hypothetical protein